MHKKKNNVTLPFSMKNLVQFEIFLLIKIFKSKNTFHPKVKWAVPKANWSKPNLTCTLIQ